MKTHRIILGVIMALMPLAVLTAAPSITQFNPPPSGQYHIEQLWKVTLNNPDQQTYSVWLEGTILKEGREVFWAQTDTFPLPPGRKTLHYKDVRVKTQRNASGYEQFAARTGGLPEGNYTFSVKLEPNFGTKSVKFSVKPMAPPRLIAPRDGSVVPAKPPRFQWTQPMPPVRGVTYSLKVVEVRRGQIPEEAMASMRPWFYKAGISGPGLQYPRSARALQARRRYAWMVVAMLGRTTIGKSSIWTFMMPAPIPPPGPKTELYFCDAGEVPGSVYRRPTVGPETKIYTRPSGRIYAFLLAPWDADKLYFVNANQFNIYVKDLGPGAPPESIVHTHTTYVRDIEADPDGRMYFSEATGAGGDGRVYRLNPDGTASLHYTVALSRVDGFWSGNFCFDRDGMLYLSTGNQVGAGVYEVDVAADVITRLYTADPPASIKGLTFGQDGLLYYGDWKQRIYALDLETGTRSQVYYKSSRKWTSDVAFKPFDPGVEVPGGVSNWVMPWGVGGTMRPQIDSATGLTSYSGVDSAPFGGRLGFRSGASSVIPTSELYYYRWEYRPQSGGSWTDFDEEVRVHYVKEVLGFLPSFPTMKLGPFDVGGKNLYRFKPHNAPTIPGATTYWPTSGFLGDIYSGYLSTSGLHLAPDKYEVRLSVYNQLANKKNDGTGFRFVVPTTEDPDGTIHTRLPATNEQDAGGFKFLLHVDNRSCSAYVNAPTVGGVAANDTCGFLRYDPADTSPVHVAYHASQPGSFARFKFRIVRGIMTCDSSHVLNQYVFADSAGVYDGDLAGNFEHDFLRSTLLGPCTEAAFSENLYVYAKATRGWGTRISSYDASFVRAFALSEMEE